METPWYRQTAEQILAAQDVDAKTGLPAAEIDRRRAEYGENVLSQGKKRTVAQMLLDQLKDFMVLVLLAACALSALLGEHTDALLEDLCGVEPDEAKRLREEGVV